MAIKDILLAEFDNEAQITRRVLERVPEKFDWQPHKKSMTLGRLASHVAEMPGWGANTLERDSFDFAPVGAAPYQPPVIKGRADLLKIFDEGAKRARAALEKTSDADFAKPWSLLRGGQPMFTAPRIAALRSFVMNHLVHHRGQLSVYLRLNDVPVPSIYGPSADEGKM
jgi:uncharacterized damage-inducible protein DinB